MQFRHISTIAVCLIVCLRVAIGWQLFYEGIWKISTVDTPMPWTSAGYLKNSQGPLRQTFRSLVGDPDDFDWLDWHKVSKKWNDWEQRFSQHYQLDKKQRVQLDRLINGPKAFYSDKGKLSAIPEGVDLNQVSVIKYASDSGRLEVDGKKHMNSREFQKLLAMAPLSDPVAETPEQIKDFREQLTKVYQRAAKLSYGERLKANLLGNPDVAGVKNKQGTSDRIGSLDKYRHMLTDYRIASESARQDFQYDHLQRLWSDIQKERALLVGPMKALDKELKDTAQKKLTISQLKKGKLSEGWTGLRISDVMIMAGLTILGFCLIVGLFTRIAAVFSAIMLFSFYLAMPPLPGLPEAPGPEHSLIVNKNLIEVFALLAIASVPSGYWLGLDRLVARGLAWIGHSPAADK